MKKIGWAVFIAAVFLAAPLSVFAERVSLYLGETLEGKTVKVTSAFLKTEKLKEQCFLKFKDRTMFIRKIDGRRLSGVYLILDVIPREEITAESGRYMYDIRKGKIFLTLYSGTFYGAATHRQQATTHVFDRYYTELKVAAGK